MKIKVTKKGEVHFVAKNQSGNELHIDGTPEIGGINAGFRPMELLLTSIVTCSLMDFVVILKKMRQPFSDISVDVEGIREKEDEVKPFKNIVMHFKLKGNLDQQKVQRALSLAIEKYCSAASTLREKTTLEYTFSIQNTPENG